MFGLILQISEISEIGEDYQQNKWYID